MGAYEYTAVDPSGKQHKGVLEGDTPRQVRQLLRDRELLPLAVSEIASQEKQGGQRTLSLRRGISPTDLALVTRQLATLVRSGMPLEEALLAVGQQSEKPRLKSIILGVRSRVMEGHTLADGLADFPQAFPDIYRATVAAGEQSGHLDAVLERLADYAESRQQLRQKIAGAMVYPIILTVVAVFIVGLLLVYVMPKVVQVFDNFNQELPGLTSALIAISDFLQAYGLLTLVILAGLVFAVSRWLRNPDIRRSFHRNLLRLPLFGQLVKGLNTARLTKTFSILAGSGVPILESMRISGNVISNIPMREAVGDAALRVREGAPIGKSLAVSGLFPPMCIHLISSGEASGQLEEMLERAATNQEREVDGTIAALLNVLQPLLILVMGGFVLLIVLAILMPIFELNQLIG